MTQTQRMTKGRRALLIGAALVLVAALAVGGLVMLFPTERIGLMVTAQMEEALDREVRIESFGIRIFPRPAVALTGVEVSRDARPGSPGSADAADVQGSGDFQPLLASVERIDLRPRIWPLLRGEVIVDEVVVARPNLSLEIPEGGVLDLPDFESAEEPADRDARVEIRSIVVRDGSILYHDANTGTRVSATGIDHDLGLDAQVTAGELSRMGLQGTLSVASVDAELPGTLAAPLRDISVAVEHDAELDPAADRLDLTRLDLTVQEFPLEVAGTVEALSDPALRTVELRARGEEIDVARLVRSLPPELLEGVPRGPNGEVFTGTGGRVTLDAEATGRAGNGEVPDVSGRLLLADVALGHEDRDGDGNLLEALSGEVGFSLDAATTEAVTGRLLGEPFELSFDVRDFADPRGTGSLRATFDLAEAVRLGFAPEGVEASGRIDVDVAAEGSAAEPEGASVNGSAQFTEVALTLPEVGPPVTVPAARVDFAGAGLTAADVAVRAGASDASIDVAVRDWLALVLPDAELAPEVSFSIVSGLLDADELLEADPERPTYAQLALAQIGDGSIDGRTASEHAAEMGLRLPELGDMLLDGRIQIQRAVMAELVYENVDAIVTGGDGELNVPEATFSVVGGEVRIQAALGPAGASEGDLLRPLEVEYAVTDAQADAFLQEYTLLQGRVDGRLNLTGTVRMDLHPNTLPERERVAGEGTLAIQEGELRNWPVAQELGRRLGVAELADFERLQFEDWSGNYQIAGSRILIDESAFERSDLAARVSGSFGIGGELDLGATLLLPGEWASRIPGASSAFVAALSEGEDGRVPIGAAITGTTTSPQISLDLSEAGARAADAVREEVESEVRERLRRFLP